MTLMQYHKKCPFQYGCEQGCGAVVKMTQLRLRSSSFHEHGSGSSSGALGFHECVSAPAPELSFFMAPAPTRVSVHFHKLIFSIVLVCLKVMGK